MSERLSRKITIKHGLFIWQGRQKATGNKICFFSPKENYLFVQLINDNKPDVPQGIYLNKKSSKIHLTIHPDLKLLHKQEYLYIFCIKLPQVDSLKLENLFTRKSLASVVLNSTFQTAKTFNYCCQITSQLVCLLIILQIISESLDQVKIHLFSGSHPLQRGLCGRKNSRDGVQDKF